VRPGATREWTARTTATWVTVKADGGSGDSVLRYDIAANDLPEARSAEIRIGEARYVIHQEARR